MLCTFEFEEIPEQNLS